MSSVTQADIDTLNRAIADGVRQVTLRGQTVTYNTTASLIQARDDMQRQLTADLARANGKAMPKQTYLHYAGRGY